MYTPVGSPCRLRQLSSPEDNDDVASAAPRTRDALRPEFLVANAAKSLFLVVSAAAVAVWKSRPRVLIVSRRRSLAALKSEGRHLPLGDWKPDSTRFVVATSGGLLIVYRCETERQRSGGLPKRLAVQTDSKKPGLRRESAELLVDDEIPSLCLDEAAKETVAEEGGEVTSLVTMREDIYLATSDGRIRSFDWTAQLLSVVDLRNVTFSSSIHHHHVHQRRHSFASGLEVNVISGADHIKEMSLCPLMGGVALVLASGHAALMRTPNARLDDDVFCVWIPEVVDGVCVAVNHQHRLLVVGCRNGDAKAFVIEDSTGCLKLNHAYLEDKFRSDDDAVATKTTTMRWTPDGSCLAVARAGGRFTLWSAFGGLVYSSSDERAEDPLKGNEFVGKVKSIEWSLEGFELWIVADEDKGHAHPIVEGHANHLGDDHDQQLFVVSMAKSALTSDASLAQQRRHLFLLSGEKLFLNSSDFLTRNLKEGEGTWLRSADRKHRRSTPSKAFDRENFNQRLLSNNQWLTVPLPHVYLVANWPPRHAAVDDTGSLLAVAGQYGLAHYSTVTRRWKLFGNEAQERDMAVSGGLFWWRDFLCAAVYNIVENVDEMRFYPRGANLDNSLASIHRLDTPVLNINHVASSSSGILLLFGLDFRVLIYAFHVADPSLPPDEQSVLLSKLGDVSVENYVPHPTCVVGAYLSPFRIEEPATSAPPQNAPPQLDAALLSFTQSLLLNVSGKLLLFQGENSSRSDAVFSFMAPVILASCVENVWIPKVGERLKCSSRRMHLLESLWLGCGHVGVKLWLPLNPSRPSVSGVDAEDSFVSKRIMLTIPTQVYPLAILYEEGLLVGCVSHSVSLSLSRSTLWSIERRTQLFLPKIILHLLRQNLGRVGLRIVRPIQKLPYFSHVLELLLHEVLEEEGTSSEPLPDALLPKVLSFVREFKEYLHTIAHCARKTEMTLWPHLFAAVGNPSLLFDECLAKKDPETAAAYLLVLQNLEKPSHSYEFATRLLTSVLELKRWDLANDLVRFLKSIDPSDLEESSPSGKSPWSPTDSVSVISGGFPLAPTVAHCFSHARSPSPPQTGPTAVFDRRTSSLDFSSAVPCLSTDAAGCATSGSGVQSRPSLPEVNKLGRPRSRPASLTIDTELNPHKFVENILTSHAKTLLSEYRLKDLGFFSAHVNPDDFQLLSWLKRTRTTAAPINDFVDALLRLHKDFDWPLPNYSHSAFIGILKKTSASFPQSNSEPNFVNQATMATRQSNAARPQSTIVSTQASLTAMNKVLLAHSQSSKRSPNSSLSTEAEKSILPPPMPPSTLTLRSPSLPPFVLPPPLHAPDQFGSHTMEAFLRPQLPREASAHTVVTSNDFSEESSSLVTEDGAGGGVAFDNTLSMLQASELYQLSQELAMKGSPESELELRYLYQIFLEAGCLSWCVLIAVLLHDGFSVIRIVNASRMEELGSDGVERLRAGLDRLNRWAEDQSPGYKPFLTALKIHTTSIINAAGAGDVRSAGQTILSAREASLVAIDDSIPVLAKVGVSTPVFVKGGLSPPSESHVSRKTSSVSTTRSRSETPDVPSLEPQTFRHNGAFLPDLATPASPDDVLMTSATSSRGFLRNEDDDEVNGNRSLVADFQANVVVNGGGDLEDPRFRSIAAE